MGRVWLKRYGPYGAAVAMALLAAGGFLGRAPAEFPIDDAYIHFVYAENLADGYGLTFNRGEFTGLGTTSILWVLVLAGFRLAGVSVPLAAKLLGVGSLALLAAAVYDLAYRLFFRWRGPQAVGPALCSAGLVAFSGNLVWFSLSGMETLFFLAWGFLALAFYWRRRFVLLGVALGLLALTRVEGILLAGVIVLLEVASEKRLGWPVGIVVGVVAACLTPWIGFVFWKTGHFLPTSFAGKKVGQMLGMNQLLAQRPLLHLILGMKPVVYLLGWATYLTLFVLGAGARPGRPPTWYRWEVQPDFQVSLVGLLLVLLIAVPLLGRAVRLAWRFGEGRSWLAEWGDRPLMALLGWFLLHNLAYMIMLPNLGTASRYAALNHVVLWLALAVGVWTLPWDSRWFKLGIVGVMLLAGTDFGRWSEVYAANIEHMQRVRIAAAQYIDRRLPPEAPVAAHDIGAVKYFGHRRVVDLGGLIDTAFVSYLRQKRVADYLQERGVEYLVIPAAHSAEKGGGWYDYLGADHLNLRQQPQVDLLEERRFEIDRTRWLIGAQPTWNALAAVLIYRLRWHRPARPPVETDGR